MNINKNTARSLRKSVRYPTYQLSAYSEGSPETVENRLVLGILHILEWSRTKFQEFEIPQALMAPSPEEYLQTKLSDMESAYINEGYTLETVCLPEHRLWAFRLVEPDLSVKWINGEAVSCAVPGRIFETNVAFSVVGSQVRCGVKLMMSEPEGVDIPGRVFRPAFVRHLAEDPKFGLFCGYPIRNQLYDLQSRERIKALKDYLESGTLPVTIFCEAAPSSQPKELHLKRIVDVPPSLGADSWRIPLAQHNLSFPLGMSPLGMPQPNMPLQTSLKKTEEPRLPPYTEKYVRTRMGYVHSFCLPYAKREYFHQIFHVSPGDSGILFMEPKQFGGGITVFPRDNNEDGETFGPLMELSRDYLNGKPVSFGQVRFLNDVKMLQAEDRRKAARTSEEMASVYEERLALMEDAHADDLMMKNNELDRMSRTIAKLTYQLESADEQKMAEEEAFQKKLVQAKKREELLTDQIQFLESLRTRPKVPKDIPAWVSERFAGRLVLHYRAEKMLQSLSSNETDTQLLCDALEYLAMEYRDQKAGLLSRDEADMACARKYNRPFVVAPSGDASIQMFPEDYMVPYASEKKNQPQKRALNWHLKIGNTTENLLRIYYFFDDTKKVVVVGSLPSHLRTATIQA